MKERRAPQPVVVRCKLVLVGDVQCGKTAMLQVLAKDCYPEVSCPPPSLSPGSPTRGRFPPAQDSHLPHPQPAPPSAALWLEDCPALPSPETCPTSAAPLTPLHLFTYYIPSFLSSLEALESLGFFLR